MSDPQSALSIFNKLSKEKITELSEFFDESIVSKMPDEDKVREIIGNEYSDYDLQVVITSFFNFFNSKLYPDQMFEIIDSSNVEKEKKDFLKETIKKIHDKIDPEKIKEDSQYDFLQDFGHPHLHKIGIIPEFRPILKDGQIIKFVSSIVVSGTVHNPYEKDEEASINFQTDVKGAESLVKNLTHMIEETKTQISEIRKKFGDNIID